MTTVLGREHRKHDPSHQVDDGQIVDVLDRPERVDALLRGVRSVGTRVVAPTAHGEESLLTVHDPGMLRFLATAYARWSEEGRPGPVIPDSFGPRGGPARIGADASARVLAGYYCRDTCSPIMASTWSAAREAADLALTGADLIRSGTGLVYGLCRPPGHHAAVADFSGFCYLNNTALAAASLRELGRVAVVDLDFHHGNGTQDVFWADPQVFYGSVHGHPDRHFPFFSGFPDEVGVGDARDTTFNLPLPDGTDGLRYRATVDRLLERVLRFDPATVVVSLGLDIAADDPVGTFDVGDEDLWHLGRSLVALGRPLLVIQEGGYALARLEEQIGAFFRGALHLPAAAS
ncbi:histone deacetylase family protein [Micromonospora sp. NBC_01740]|uniref:histone deacetylase family protein n=1 Tax=Micromonospora sp. NBC_01740 TaxID=2975986 RepID=UPI002E0DCA79|nr:histone deacetylase family protein [Micromonospora sp. NBC_01740]